MNFEYSKFYFKLLFYKISNFSISEIYSFNQGKYRKKIVG